MLKNTCLVLLINGYRVPEEGYYGRANRHKKLEASMKMANGPVAGLIDELHALRRINLTLMDRLRNIRKKTMSFVTLSPHLM